MKTLIPYLCLAIFCLVQPLWIRAQSKPCPAAQSLIGSYGEIYPTAYLSSVTREYDSLSAPYNYFPFKILSYDPNGRLLCYERTDRNKDEVWYEYPDACHVIVHYPVKFEPVIGTNTYGRKYEPLNLSVLDDSGNLVSGMLCDDNDTFQFQYRYAAGKVSAVLSGEFGPSIRHTRLIDTVDDNDTEWVERFEYGERFDRTDSTFYEWAGGDLINTFSYRNNRLIRHSSFEYYDTVGDIRHVYLEELGEQGAIFRIIGKTYYPPYCSKHFPKALHYQDLESQMTGEEKFSDYEFDESGRLMSFTFADEWCEMKDGYPKSDTNTYKRGYRYICR